MKTMYSSVPTHDNGMNQLHSIINEGLMSNQLHSIINEGLMSNQFHSIINEGLMSNQLHSNINEGLMSQQLQGTVVSPNSIAQYTQQLKKGKGDGNYGFTSDHCMVVIVYMCYCP